MKPRRSNHPEHWAPLGGNMGQSACVCYWPCLCTSIQGAHMAVRRNKDWIRHKNLNLYSFGRFEKELGTPWTHAISIGNCLSTTRFASKFIKTCATRCLACMSWVFCQCSSSLFQNGSKMQLVRAELAQIFACVLLLLFLHVCICSWKCAHTHAHECTTIQTQYNILWPILRVTHHLRQ